MRLNLWLIILLLCGFLLVMYYKNEAHIYQNKALMYRKQSEILNQRLTKIYETKYLLEQKYEALEKAAASERAKFDWYFDIADSAVIKQLQSR